MKTTTPTTSFKVSSETANFLTAAKMFEETFEAYYLALEKLYGEETALEIHGRNQQAIDAARNVIFDGMKMSIVEKLSSGNNDEEI